MRWVTFVVVAACSFNPGRPGEVPDDDSGVPPIDAAPDPVCAATWTYAPSNFDPCAGVIIHPPLVLTPGSYVFAPATGVLEKDGSAIMTLATTGSSPRILSLEGLTVEGSASLRITGAEPLIIGVHGNATITGRLDVSAQQAQSGPGGGSCAGGTGGNGKASPERWSAGGGGAGGAFGSIGAAGGTGDVEPTFPKTPGGPEMAAEGEAMLVPLRGGCRGGAGGEEDPSCTSQGTPGAGGGAGGAIQVSVRNTFAIADGAQIAANGGGGRKGVNGTFGGGSHVGVGGGGGGSGGAILLEGATVTIAGNAFLCANGGGGGGGTHNNDGAIEDGSEGACAVAAAGGGNGETGDGGPGGFRDANPGPGTGGTRQDDGGGGGGGGVGRIRVRDVSGALTLTFGASPTPVID